MKRAPRRPWLWVSYIAILALASAPFLLQFFFSQKIEPLFDVIDLLPPGMEESKALAIDHSGQVLVQGWKAKDTDKEPNHYLWRQDTGFRKVAEHLDAPIFVAGFTYSGWVWGRFTKNTKKELSELAQEINEPLARHDPLHQPEIPSSDQSGFILDPSGDLIYPNSQIRDDLWVDFVTEEGGAILSPSPHAASLPEDETGTRIFSYIQGEWDTVLFPLNRERRLSILRLNSENEVIGLVPPVVSEAALPALAFQIDLDDSSVFEKMSEADFLNQIETEGRRDRLAIQKSLQGNFVKMNPLGEPSLLRTNDLGDLLSLHSRSLPRFKWFVSLADSIIEWTGPGMFGAWLKETRFYRSTTPTGILFLHFSDKRLIPVEVGIDWYAFSQQRSYIGLNNRLDIVGTASENGNSHSFILVPKERIRP